MFRQTGVYFKKYYYVFYTGEWLETAFFVCIFGRKNNIENERESTRYRSKWFLSAGKTTLLIMCCTISNKCVCRYP